jgi:ribose transport system substrate-binding protein
MFHYKRVVRIASALAVIGVLSIAVAACGNTARTSSATAGPSSSDTTVSTSTGGQAKAQAIVNKLLRPVPFEVGPLSKQPPKGKTIVEVNCTLPICVNGAVKAPAEKLGWKYINVSFDVTKGPAAYAAALTQALQDKPDYIVEVGIFPPATIQPILTKIAAAKIPVVQVSGTPDADIKACVNCATYFAHNGAIQADMVVASVGTEAETLNVGDPSVVSTVQGNVGIQSEFRRLGAKTPDTLKISINNTPQVNAAAVVSYLQSHPNVKAVMTTFTDALVTLPSALAQAGLSKKVEYFGSKPSPADIKALQDGTMTGSTVIESAAAFWQAVDSLARLSVGDTVNSEPSNWFALANKSNINTIVKAGNGVPEPPAFEQQFEKAWQLS